MTPGGQEKMVKSHVELFHLMTFIFFSENLTADRFTLREELGTAFQPRIFGIASGIKIGLFIKYHSHLAFLIHHTPRTTKCFPQFSKDI